MGTSRLRTGFEQFDIDARERQVSGRSQRIAPLGETEFTDEAKELADAIRTVFGVADLTGIPDIFTTMFKHSGIHRSQLQIGVELDQQGALPARLRELAILRTGWSSRSHFRWGSM